MTGPGYLIDASVAVKLVLTEPGSDAAARLMGSRLVAPDLLLPECASVIGKAERRRELDPAQALLACAALLALPIELVPSRRLLPAALARAAELRQSAYECLYIEAAFEAGLALVTADRRLARLAVPGVRILALDDLP